MPYYSYQVKDIIARGQENVNLSRDLWDQLEVISRSMKENDNPVLIVGNTKGI